MNADDWDAISILLDKGFKWREPFGEIQAGAYRMLLDGYSSEQVMVAVRALVVDGQVFGPTPGEIVARIRQDPSTPTFEEAYELIYGKGGIVRARPTGNLTFGDQASLLRAYHQARVQRAQQVHPRVGSFVLRYGINRLYELPLHDPVYGDVKRRELEAAWNRHVEAMDGREVAAIAAGDRSRGALRLLDPLAALGGHTVPAGELEAGQ